jgi:hypothetical protein
MGGGRGAYNILINSEKEQQKIIEQLLDRIKPAEAKVK